MEIWSYNSYKARYLSRQFFLDLKYFEMVPQTIFYHSWSLFGDLLNWRLNWLINNCVHILPLPLAVYWLIRHWWFQLPNSTDPTRNINVRTLLELRQTRNFSLSNHHNLVFISFQNQIKVACYTIVMEIWSYKSYKAQYLSRQFFYGLRIFWDSSLHSFLPFLKFIWGPTELMIELID